MTQLGTFVESEVPEPIEYQFLDDDGAPIDLTGYDATFSLKIGRADAVSLPATVSDDEAGKVTHVWLDGELVRTDSYGSIRAEFTVTNGTNTYVSVRLQGYLRTALVTA